MNRGKLVLAVATGATVSAGAVFGSVYQATSPLNTVPWALPGGSCSAWCGPCWDGEHRIAADGTPGTGVAAPMTRETA